MRLPNKVTCYKESIIAKFPLVLNLLLVKEYSVTELFNLVHSKVEDINELVDILDSLFALGKININQNSGRLYYVVWNYLW